MRAVAQRYARALVDTVLELGSAERLKGELASFAELVNESADLRTYLASPAVARPSKQAVIERLVARLGASRTLRNFLFVLVDNRRTNLLPQIRQAFDELLYARQGIAEAHVRSARELSATEKQDLQRALERLAGKTVESRYELDPALIAGAVVRIGSTIYDGSVRAQLNRLRTRLAAESE
jgi:F-type H+-transporting ATPase subunit delta